MLAAVLCGLALCSQAVVIDDNFDGEYARKICEANNYVGTFCYPYDKFVFVSCKNKQATIQACNPGELRSPSELVC